jgi:hypothetical protein
LRIENGKLRIENGKLRIENGKLRIENGKLRMEKGRTGGKVKLSLRISHVPNCHSAAERRKLHKPSLRGPSGFCRCLRYAPT